jgi:hypothetical protein
MTDAIGLGESRPTNGGTTRSSAGVPGGRVAVVVDPVAADAVRVISRYPA